MLAGRLQVLADGEKIHVGRAQVVHHLHNLVSRLSPSPTIRPDLVNIVGIEFLGPLKQAQRVEIARAGPDRQIEPRHGFEIVVEDVGLAAITVSSGAVLAQEIRRQHFDGRAGARRADGAIIAAKCAAPPSARSSRSTDVMTTCFRPSVATASATLLGSVGIERAGKPRLHIAEGAGARAGVAHDHHGRVLFVQHSPIFGQPASSQTVCRLFVRTISAVFA